MLAYIANTIKDMAQVPFIYRNFWTAYADYFRLLRNQTVTYRLRNGTVFRARAGMFDIAMITEVLGTELYNRSQSDICIRPGDVVVDVGAFIGDFSVYAGRKSSDIQVYALEPSRSSFALLEENTSLNKLSRQVHLYNNGMAAATSSMELFFPANAEHSNTTDPALLGNLDGERYEIECIGVNEFLETLPHPVDYFKVDCEGAEFGIFNAIEEKHLESMRCVVIEYHLPANQPDNGRLMQLTNRLSPFFTIDNQPQVGNENLTIGMLFCRNKAIA